MTKIKQIGELEMIDRMEERILDTLTSEKVVKGIGDDCAVVEDEEDLMLLTTDMLVSGDHFNLDWHTPWQIGWKSAVVNISDIAAMGGLPEWGLVSVAIPSDTEVELIDGIYDGMADASEEYGLNLIGGDTTHGDILVINVAVIGNVEPENLCLRGDAQAGDSIFVTGDLGKSWAGLELLREGKSGYTDYHLQPTARLDEARKLAPKVNAMIDVSDGLASEVDHICEESSVGAEVYKDKIPISDRTRDTASKLDVDPYRWALSGGEDFELVFTAPEDVVKLLDLETTPITKVGRITEKGIYLIKNGEKKDLGGGYDHFDL